MVFFERAILLTTKDDQSFLAKKCAHIEKHLGFPKGFVEVFHNEPDREDPKRGCFNAHHQVYCYITEHNINNCLIFEDDVHFLAFVPQSSYELFLRSHEWDVFYFGHKPDFRQDTFVRRTQYHGIIQVRTNDRHAYAMNYEFAKAMSQKPWTGLFGDRLLRSSTDKAYALAPAKAIQSGPWGTASHYNGITEKFSEYLRLANQRPFWMVDFIKYTFLLVFKMPYWIAYFSFLAWKHKE